MLRLLSVFENIRKVHPTAGVGIAERDFPRLPMHWIFHGPTHSNLLTSTDAL